MYLIIPKSKLDTFKNLDVYPHFTKVIPVWYAKEQDLKNLQSP